MTLNRSSIYQIVPTEDGSPTLRDDRNETFHSRHGAAQETRHVFIANGLDHYRHTEFPTSLTIAEIGFGTGLNAAMAWQYALTHAIPVTLITCETTPLPQGTATLFSKSLVNYDSILGSLHQKIIDSDWNIEVQLDSFFSITKHPKSAQEIEWYSPIHVVWFDAFSPRTSPDCWTDATLSPLVSAMADNGVLTTYCAKGSVRRSFQSLGLTVERLQGPPGKREMLRGTRLAQPQSEIVQ